MNRSIVILGVLFLMCSAVSAQFPGQEICCTWIAGTGCYGFCDEGTTCIEVATEQCACEPIVGCHWDPDEQSCVGSCGEGSVCTQTYYGVCECEPVIDECHWDYDEGACIGTCDNGGSCIQIDEELCTCDYTTTTLIHTPEAGSFSVLLAILLASPAFAYLIVRK